MSVFKRFWHFPIVKWPLAAIILVAYGLTHAQSIVLSSTTSTEQSALLPHLLPAFK